MVVSVKLDDKIRRRSPILCLKLPVVKMLVRHLSAFTDRNFHARNSSVISCCDKIGSKLTTGFSSKLELILFLEVAIQCTRNCYVWRVWNDLVQTVQALRNDCFWNHWNDLLVKWLMKELRHFWMALKKKSFWFFF